MANNSGKYLKRRFTVRETILLAVLIVILFVGLYFGLVYYPLSTRTSEVQTQIDDLQVRLTVAKSLKEQYDEMKAELARIEASGDDTVMPQHGKKNEQEVVLYACFDTIFAGMESSYYSTISPPSDGIITRTVSFSFTVTAESAGAAYTKTREVLTALMTTKYRCSMSSLSLSPASGDLENDTSINVNCAINFYELDSGSAS